jgi:dTDP-4-dehydrorhamnose reductase
MRALVLGAGGTLGQALSAFLPGPEGGGWTVDARGRADCDIADPEQVERALAESRAQVVFNTAAFTNVDRAEDDPDAAFRANALAPELLARATERHGATLLHYSTDFVFDGERERPYDEFDAPAPQGIYARSKVAGERLAAAATRRLFVVRVGCLYGRNGKNFPSTILRRLRAGETVRADRERLGSPTWVMDVARASAALVTTAHYGLYHATSQGETTWESYARFLADELHLPSERVVGLATHELPMMKAPRPRRAILDNRMLRLRGLDLLPDWQSAARAYLRSETAAAVAALPLAETETAQTPGARPPGSNG